MLSYNSGTALIIVDVQNDFADPAGSLYVDGAADLIGPINREIITATSGSAFVVYTQDWHPQSTPHFEKDGGIWPVHCVGNTWGSELHSRLIVAGPIVRKGVNGEDGYSGFTVREPATGEESPTEMTALLNERGITSTIVIGLALDYCVGATARDSSAAGFRTRVSLDHTAAVELKPGDGARMVERLVREEVVVG